MAIIGEITPYDEHWIPFPEILVKYPHQIIRAEVAPRFIYGGKAQAFFIAVKFLFGFEYRFLLCLS